MKFVVVLTTLLVCYVCFVSCRTVVETKLAMWTSGMETFNLKQQYPDVGLFNETAIAESVPIDRDLLMLLEIYEDAAAIEIIDKLKSHYPYYYRPRNVTGTKVQCKPADVSLIQAFFGCLVEKKVTALSFQGILPCTSYASAIVAQNTDCWECITSTAFMQQIQVQSNELNRAAGHNDNLYPTPTIDAVSACLASPQPRYIYEGGVGFLLLMKEPIKSLDGSALPNGAIGLSAVARKNGVLVSPSQSKDGGIFVETPALTLARAYLQFQFRGLRILALYNPYTYNVTSREADQLTIAKKALGGSKTKFDLVFGNLSSGPSYQNAAYYYFKDTMRYTDMPMPRQPNDGTFNVTWGTQYPDGNTICWNNYCPRCSPIESANHADIDHFMLRTTPCLGKKCVTFLDHEDSLKTPWTFLPYDPVTKIVDKYTVKSQHPGLSTVLRYKLPRQ